MDSIYIVRSHFENYDSTSWKIIGLFTDKKIAEEIAKKWEDFYEEKMYNIFNEPKDWKPTSEDLQYGGEWYESEEYSQRTARYSEVMDFREIVIEEFELNKDRSLEDTSVNEYLLSLMTQWDRNHKLEKIIK
jgi:hypothetical protein